MVKLVTWNMQGGAASGENKWHLVDQLAKDYDIVCLQECGKPPGTVPGKPHGDLTMCTRNTKVGRDRLQLNIILYEWTQTNARVNMAIVSQKTLINPMLIGNPKANLRGAVRATMGSIDYFSIHGCSGGKGFDIPKLLEECCLSSSSRLCIAGDFNKEFHLLTPANIPDGCTKNPPNENTHSVSAPNKMIDYCITRDALVWGSWSDIWDRTKKGFYNSLPLAITIGAIAGIKTEAAQGYNENDSLFNPYAVGTGVLTGASVSIVSSLRSVWRGTATGAPASKPGTVLKTNRSHLSDHYPVAYDL